MTMTQKGKEYHGRSHVVFPYTPQVGIAEQVEIAVSRHFELREGALVLRF